MPILKIQPVSACATENGICASVVPDTDDVIAVFHEQGIVADADIDNIIARPGIDQIAAIPIVDRVIAGSAENRVVAAACIDVVVAGPTVDPIRPIGDGVTITVGKADPHHIIAGAAIDHTDEADGFDFGKAERPARG